MHTSDNQPPETKTKRLLHLLMTFFVTGPIGIHVSTSYLIKPTADDCPWSETPAVIGGALMMGVFGITASFSGRLLDQYGPPAFLFSGTIAAGLSYGVCGIAALTCHYAPILTAVVYTVSFGCVGLFVGLNYMAALPALLSWFPKNRGRANAFNATCRGIGAVWLAQLFLYCQGRVHSGEMRAGTIFFIVGLISMAASAPFIPVTEFAVPRGQRTKGLLKSVLKTRQIKMIFYGFFGIILPFWGVEGRLDQILIFAWPGPDKDAPVKEMALVVLVAYTTSRIFWMITADCIGVINIWRLANLIEGGILLALPSAIEAKSRAGGMAAVALISIQFALASGVKGTAAALCCDLFPESNASTALGVVLLAPGTAGFLGPIICHFTYLRYHSYAPFLYGSSALPLVGFVVLLFVKPVEEEETPILQRDDYHDIVLSSEISTSDGSLKTTGSYVI